MPRCSARIAQYLQEADQPVLSWLAPRVFKPWPRLKREQSRSFISDLAREPCHRQRQNGQCSQSSLRCTDRTVLKKTGPKETQRSFHATCILGQPNRMHRGSSSSYPVPPGPSQGHTKGEKLREWYEEAFGPLEGSDPASSGKNSHTEHNMNAIDQKGMVTKADTRTNSDGHESTQHSCSEHTPRTPRIRRVAQQKEPLQRPERLLALELDRFRLGLKTDSNSRPGKAMHTHKKLPEFSPTRSKFVSLGRPMRRRAIDGVAQEAHVGLAHSSGESLAGAHEEELQFITTEYSTFWNRNFAILHNRLDSESASSSLAGEPPRILPAAEEWARSILTTEDKEASRAALEESRGISYTRKWAHAMLWTLENEPDQAVRFLQQTHLQPFVAQSWIVDSVYFIILRLTGNFKPETCSTIVDCLCEIMERPGAPPLRLEGSAIRHLIYLTTPEQTVRLRESMKTNNVHVHAYTLLHFAQKLARSQHLHSALDCLLESAGAGLNLDDDAFLSVCSTILRNAVEQPDGLRLCLLIISNLVKIGTKINVQLCNIVMLNAVEAGDLKTAFAVFHSLVDHGLKADKYTYAILLKGCKKTFRDGETLNAIIREAIKGLDIKKAHVVATEILHCLQLHHFDRNQDFPGKAFRNLVAAYSELFDPGPLTRLGVIQLPVPSNKDTTLMPPTVEVIGIMIGAYLRASRTANTKIVHDLYCRVRELALSGEEPFARLLAADYIPNAFLMSFVWHSHSMIHAAEVIRDMQNHHSSHPESTTDTISAEQPSPPTTRTRPPSKKKSPAPEPPFTPPTAQSWSIFLHGFTRHRKIDLAEQVMAYMRERGIRPTQVTWNTLVNGYAGVGDAKGAVKALERMEEEGFGGDEFTERIGGKVARLRTREWNPLETESWARWKREER